MAAVFIVREHDPERRRLGMQSAATAMRRFEVEIATSETGVIGVVRGAFPGAPVNVAPGAFLIGDVIPGPGPEHLDAGAYARRVAEAGVPPPCDGYHVAATFDAAGALTVATDVLGFFPLYVAVSGSALLIASSPALITAYPGFAAVPDPLGLAGLLVVNGPVRGRTPYRGIRRLARGHALVAAPDGPPREAPQYAIDLHRESHDVPVEECGLRLHEALVSAARRHVPDGEPHTMLLSGGLDSRIMAGVLARQGVPMNAVTRGRRLDLEYRCARAVARRLGLTQHLQPHAESFAGLERMLWWDGMACAPGLAGGNGLAEPMTHAHPRFVSGFLADPIVGGLTLSKSFDRGARTAGFDPYLRRTNAWGVPLDALPGLLRKDVFGDAVQTVVDELREDYLGAAPGHMRRAWMHSMDTRQRFGQGLLLAHHAFVSWPRLPQIDREVLHVAAGIPAPVLAGRRLEYHLLERFHPDLARLPLDRNDPDTTPPLPGFADLVRAGIDRRVRHWRERLGIPRPDRRYYHRTFDFNGAPWRASRRRAEPDRERAYALFEREAFDALVPPPDAPWPSTGTIEGGSAVKLLTSLAVWLRVGFA